MKWLLVLTLMTLTFSANADAVSRAAMKYGQRAFFAYPIVKKMKRDTERYLFSFLPVDKEKIAIFGGVCFTLLSGNLSTRSFNNLRVGVLGWNVSPELAMNIRTGQAFALISLNKEF